MAIRNEKLEAARLKKCWTLAIASEQIGVSPDTYNRWELGLQVPRLSSLRLLRKAFGMSAEELGFAQLMQKKAAVTVPLDRQITTQEQSSQGLVLLNQLLSEVGALTPSLAEHPQLSLREHDPWVDYTKRSLEAMDQPRELEEKLSRRQAITLLTGVPAAVFGLMQSGSVLHPEEMISLSTVNIPLCWRLYFEGGLKEVKQVLPGYLAHLSDLVQGPSHYRRKAAALASQGYQLASLLALQSQDFGLAQNYATRAFQYGEGAENPNLQTAALVRQALVSFYLKRPAQKLQLYQQALRYSDESSFLLQSRVYMGLAEAYAHMGQEHEARNFLERAYNAFPEDIEDDPSYLYTHFGRVSLLAYDGLMSLHLKQPKQAWNAFAQNDALVPATLVPDRVELLGRQTSVSIALGDLDQSSAYLRSFATSALALGSDLRYEEALALYQNMQAKWGREPRVKDMAELFLR